MRYAYSAFTFRAAPTAAGAAHALCTRAPAPRDEAPAAAPSAAPSTLPSARCASCRAAAAAFEAQAIREQSRLMLRPSGQKGSRSASPTRVTSTGSAAAAAARRARQVEALGRHDDCRRVRLLAFEVGFERRSSSA